MEAALGVHHLSIPADRHPDMLQIIHVLNIIVPIVGIFYDKGCVLGDDDLPLGKGLAPRGFFGDGIAHRLQRNRFILIKVDDGRVTQRQLLLGHLLPSFFRVEPFMKKKGDAVSSASVPMGAKVYSPVFSAIYLRAFTAYSKGLALAGSCSASTTTQPS